MVWVGVDPGKNGGDAIIDEANVTVFPWDDQKFVDAMKIVTMMQEGGKPAKAIAAVEKVGAMPGQGVTSMFNFGKSAGFIEGVLTALGIPFQLVPPATWKREFSLIGKDKRASIEVCKRLFPGVSLRRTEKCKTDSDGMAEALLIAEYARRHL